MSGLVVRFLGRYVHAVRCTFILLFFYLYLFRSTAVFRDGVDVDRCKNPDPGTTIRSRMHVHNNILASVRGLRDRRFSETVNNLLHRLNLSNQVHACASRRSMEIGWRFIHYAIHVYSYTAAVNGG